MLKFKHNKKYFSPSQLKKLYLSVGQLNAYISKIWTSSKQMDLGTAVHIKLLEPHLWDERYIVLDDDKIVEEIGGARPTSTKKYKDWLLSFESENKGKTLISKADNQIVETIYHKCAMTGIIDSFFTGGESEKTITGVAKSYNEEFKALCIIDYDTDFMSVDLKTTSKPLHKFKFDANELGYDIQASLTNSLNGKEFVFVVVQTVAPYDIGVFTLSDYFKNRGTDKINKALLNYQYYENEYSTQVLNFEL